MSIEKTSFLVNDKDNIGEGYVVILNNKVMLSINLMKNQMNEINLYRSKLFLEDYNNMVKKRAWVFKHNNHFFSYPNKILYVDEGLLHETVLTHTANGKKITLYFLSKQHKREILNSLQNDSEEKIDTQNVRKSLTNNLKG